jgi:fatty acid desaturase
LLVIALRVHCIRFVDAFQHSYVQVAADQATPTKGRRYEQHHTFSFPVARRFRGLNLLILNFGYHNAHHALPSCPWYNLPALDSLIMSTDGSELDDGEPAPPAHQVSFVELLRGYHRHRRYRITTTDEGQAYDDALQFSMARFTGAFTDNLLG